MDVKILTLLSLFVVPVFTEGGYEDNRCRCICPSLSMVLNRTVTNNQNLFISYVPPNQCNCDSLILPKLGEDVKGREAEFCTRCECKYETRNTVIIMLVVIMVVWMVAVLLVYMAFLFCLDPLTKTRTRLNRQRVREARASEAQEFLLQIEEDDKEDV